MWYIRKSSVKNICFHHHNMTSPPVSTSQFQLRGDRQIAHRRRVFVELSQILIQDINIFKMWHKILPISVLKSYLKWAIFLSPQAAKIKAGLVVCSERN